jgi:UDP-N-acetylmuramyl pentapeptide phosphotransferase/UDP-N-acetylglucosamine-1-phosphate transferase
MIITLASFLTSLVITFTAIPAVIRVANLKHLFDEPDERKIHKSSTPTLGGIAIFAGMIFSLTFWSSQKEIIELQYIISSIILLFFIGLKDDLVNLVHYKKLIGQLMAAFILVHWADIRITSFFGLFGINDLNLIASYAFSIFVMVVITNAVNLIDGIDGLAATVGIVATLTFGTWFYLVDQTQYMILSGSVLGALFGFFHYNKSPAKIFMGDTGSLILGITMSILAIKFIEMNRVLSLEDDYKIRGIPVVAISILIIPLFDTLRVFAIRILQGKSPFNPDRNHLHHMLVDLGFSHMKATSLLALFNICMIGISLGMQNVRSEIVLTLVLMLSLAGSYGLAFAKNKRIVPVIIPLKKATRAKVSVEESSDDKIAFH